MSLLDLVQKHDRVGFSADFLCQLAAFFVSDVSWRRSDETRNSEFLHVFAHVDTNQSIFRVKEILRQNLCQICLSDACRTEEDEASDRSVRVFQTCSVTSDGFHHVLNRLILSDDGAGEL